MKGFSHEVRKRHAMPLYFVPRPPQAPSGDAHQITTAVHGRPCRLRRTQRTRPCLPTRYLASKNEAHVLAFGRTGGLHWDRPAPPASIGLGRRLDLVPFLSFDDECFYRKWALDVGQDGGTILETVFECASAAGIVAAVKSALGVALLSERHLRAEMQIVTDRLPAPPALVYVVRRARKARIPALDTLIAEIEHETKPVWRVDPDRLSLPPVEAFQTCGFKYKAS